MNLLNDSKKEHKKKHKCKRLKIKQKIVVKSNHINKQMKYKWSKQKN